MIKLAQRTLQQSRSQAPNRAPSRRTVFNFLKKASRDNKPSEDSQVSSKDETSAELIKSQEEAHTVGPIKPEET